MLFLEKEGSVIDWKSKWRGPPPDSNIKGERRIGGSIKASGSLEKCVCLRNSEHMNNTLAQFVRLRSAILAERDAVRSRLKDLDTVLGTADTSANVVSARNTAPEPPVRSETTTWRKRGRHSVFRPTLTLRHAVEKATVKRPLPIRDLVPAVQKLGYRFTSKNPYNSLGAYLYSGRGQEHFRKTPSGFSAR